MRQVSGYRFNVTALRGLPTEFIAVRHLTFQVADGGNGLQMWSVTVNILHKQSRTADKG
jgi:hypothetical protein